MSIFGLNSFLEETIFGMMADQDNRDLESYDESLVTSVMETGPQCKLVDDDCPDDDNDGFDTDGDDDDYDWDNIDFDDDNYNDSLLDDMDSIEIYDVYSNDGYRPYF